MSDQTSSKNTPRKPQDHKPKASRPKTKAVAAEAGDTLFTFDHDGVTYTLPSPQAGAENMPGKLIRDAVMSGDDLSEMRLAFGTLEGSGVEQETLDALYAKPYVEMMGIIGDWMQAVQGVSEGKS